MSTPEENIVKAKETFEFLCEFFDKKGWTYEKQEEYLIIRFTVRGDDIPMNFSVGVDPSPGLVSFVSYLPFDMDKEKMVDAAISTCAINHKFKSGMFVLELGDGSIYYKLVHMYMNSSITDEILQYMINMSNHIVDEYNDQFLMLNKGNLSLNDFLEKINS